MKTKTYLSEILLEQSQHLESLIVVEGLIPYTTNGTETFNKQEVVDALRMNVGYNEDLRKRMIGGLDVKL